MLMKSAHLGIDQALAWYCERENKLPSGVGALELAVYISNFLSDHGWNTGDLQGTVYEKAQFYDTIVIDAGKVAEPADLRAAHAAIVAVVKHMREGQVAREELIKGLEGEIEDLQAELALKREEISALDEELSANAHWSSLSPEERAAAIKMAADTGV